MPDTQDKKKTHKGRLSILSIAYITVLALVFNSQYDEVSVSAIGTVVAIAGFILALLTNYLLGKWTNR